MADWDLWNRLNWDLLLRTQREITPIENRPGDYIRISDISITCTSPVLMIGVRSENAKSYWVVGGWASMNLLVIPSTTTEFVAAVHDAASSVRCRLGQLNLIRFPELNLYPYLLIFSVPYWFLDVYLEIWQYSGSNPDEIPVSGELILSP